MRQLLARVLPVLTLLVAAVALPVAAQMPLEEGKNFIRLKNPQPTESGAKIEVIEFFSYGCPHCAHLEPELQKWIKKGLPEDVQFRRVPVLFQPAWAILARDFYTLEGLGIESKLSPDVFKAIHEQNVKLEKEQTFFEWTAKQAGIEAKKVEEMYNSFAIQSKVNRAKQLAGSYRVEAVPFVVVDGKFATGSDKIGGHPNMPAAIDALVAKARAERKK